jgi:hypothetical protein
VKVRVSVGARILTLTTLPRPVLEPTQSPIKRVLGTLSPGAKRPWREADHSLPTSAEFIHSPIRLDIVVCGPETGDSMLVALDALICLDLSTSIFVE